LALAIAGVVAALCGVATAATSIVATEGAKFTGTVDTRNLQCDPQTAGNPQATIDWGDGTAAAAGSASIVGSQVVVAGSHVYTEAGSYSGTVTVSYSCNGVQGPTFTDTVAATVSDAPLTATATPVSAAAGVTFSGAVATFDDANGSSVPADFTATVRWGDGSAESAATVVRAGGGYAVLASHTYVTVGTDATAVTIDDRGGASAAAAGTATVRAPAVQARFTVTQVSPGAAQLDASGSVEPGAAALRYTWTVGTNHAADIVCPGSEPGLALLVRRPLATSVSLTAVDTGSGAATTTVGPVSIPAPADAGSARAGSGPAFIGECSGTGSLTVRPLATSRLLAGHRPVIASAGGAPPAGCADDVVFGAADVHGCLSPIPSPRDLPSGITLGLASLLCAAHATDFCMPSLTTAASGALGTSLATHASAAALTATRQVVSTLGRAGFPSYYSWSAVRLDGIDVVPQNGTPILVIPSADAIAGTSVRLYLHGFRLTPKAIPFGIYLPSSGGHLGDVTLPHAIPIIGSLPFTGSISVDLHRAHSRLANGDVCDYACAALSVNASLPGVFTDGDGNGLSAAGVVTADAVNGLQLDSLEVMVPSAELAGIGVSNVDIRYRHGDDSLHAQATFNLFEAAGEITGTIDFVHGAFQGASVEWDAGSGPGIDLGGPLNVYLVRLGGGISLDPTTISANGAITGGPQALGCSLIGIDGSITLTFAPFALDAVAQGSLLCQHVATEFFHYDDSGYFNFGGNVDIHFALFELKGGVDVAVDVPQGHFQFDGNVSACLDLFGTHCLGAEGVISDRGIGVCADLGFTHAGGGVQFPDTVLVFFDTCDIGKFRSLGFTTAAGSASRGFTVPRRERVAVIGVVGHDGAPRVRIIGPGRRVIDTPADGFVKTPRDVVIGDDRYTHTTYFFINHPAHGRWRVEPLAGSVPVVAIHQAASVPAPSVRARIRPLSGGRERLTYTVAPIAGQTVTFAERAGNHSFRVLGRADGRRGRLDFTPSLELSRSRAIVAMVSQDGHPRADLVVARFRAPRPHALPAPSRLRGRRRGDRVGLAWRPVRTAATYLVSVRVAGGRVFHILARRAEATVTGVPLNRRVTVLVAGRRRSRWAGRQGRAARLTLAPGRLPGRVRVRVLAASD
jgi:hypothetical protein